MIAPIPPAGARPGRRGLLASALVAVMTVTGIQLVGPATPAAAYPSANVELRGHGFGHGRGMGQYGALGYALAGLPYTSILDHYYGGTSMGSIGDAPMSVRILRLDNLETIVTQEQGAATFATNNGANRNPNRFLALKVRLVAPNTFEVASGPSCGGPWTPVTTDVGSVTLGSAIPQNDERNTMLQLCEGATTRWYRGEFGVFDSGGARTVNRVGMEGYLRGVVPRESPSSWGALGAGQGMNALRAQAVAARSYAQAQNRYLPYAKTCDTESCQVYSGFAIQDPAGYRPLEAPATNQAIAETAGQVRVFTGTGTVASTEFSSSTGGHTAGGTFPAVVDDGDSVPLNPNHNWTASVPVAAIEAAYPAIGQLQSVEVTRRNGLGDFGGRVLDMVLVGTAGRQPLTGSDFRIKFALKSDWFAVTNSASGGVGGYWVVAVDGGIFSFGAARFHGSMGGHRLNQPVLGMAPTPGGGGYWLVAADGGIFSFGDSRFFGSTGNIRLNQPVVGMAATPSGNGYWLVAADGGIFAFGDARFFGSTGSIRLNRPVVGMATTPSGNGYWLVASDGGVFAFGDAQFYGSTGNIRLNRPVIGMASTPSGNGYWMIADDGGIFAFGGAPFLGSLPGARAPGPARGIQRTGSGNGYLVANDAGRVFAFGDAPFLGDVATAVPGYRGGVRGLTAVYTS